MNRHVYEQRRYAATLKGKICERDKTMRRTVRRREAAMVAGYAVLTSPEALLNSIYRGDNS